jgi:murein DD-endopeptidase MepM/ murein hydrolase activator NlpD
MRAAFLTTSSSFTIRFALFASLVGLGGCSSDARRIEMPWSVPVASNAWGKSTDMYSDTTGSIAPATSVKSQTLPAVASYSPSIPPKTDARAEIVVDQGDSLYSIARRYHIPASQLMAVNHIYNANAIKVGQRLALPNGVTPQADPVRVASLNNQFATSAPVAAAPAANISAINASEHTVGTGDTLSSIAKRYNISPGELAHANDFKPQDSLKVGQKLKIPHSNTSVASAKTKASSQIAVIQPTAKKTAPLAKVESAKIVAEAPRAKPSVAKPSTPAESVKIAKAEPAQKPATVETTASLPSPEPMNSTEFRWPVRGRIVENYGTQQGGGHNDGINIAVPSGTPIKAAENGVVAYAGSELKGYGKLILIRHDNDFVTAYAHNSTINVKRGDKVTRGQVIATAGQSGNVTQPQLHFEIRKGSTPLDPLTHLSGL